MMMMMGARGPSAEANASALQVLADLIRDGAALAALEGELAALDERRAELAAAEAEHEAG